MPPILYIIFNRPDVARQSFECIRRARPEKLIVAADAARPGVVGEAELCLQTRAVTDAIDWDCDVQRLYADTNMGCGRRIGSAISQVLDQHESCIILEDDCIPDHSFFGYCDTLLQKYADDPRVMAISGDNFQPSRHAGSNSYYFSKYPHCWGWATWKRAWQHFDLRMRGWPSFRDSGGLQTYCRTDRELNYWTAMFDLVYSGTLDTWDFPWTLACWQHSGMTALPEINLVSNIGFGEAGTHTTSQTPYANLPRFSIGDLVHPHQVFRNEEADQVTDELLYSGPWQRSERRNKRKRFWRFSKRGMPRAA